MNMELETMYREFKKIGSLNYTPERYRKYKEIKEQIFPMFKEKYLNSGEKVNIIEDIINALNEEEQDTLKFWGSEKIAERNHYVFIADKEGRLFEALCNWYGRKIDYE